MIRTRKRPQQKTFICRPMEETFLIRTVQNETLGAYTPLYIVKFPWKPLYEEKTGK